MPKFHLDMFARDEHGNLIGEASTMDMRPGEAWPKVIEITNGARSLIFRYQRSIFHGGNAHEHPEFAGMVYQHDFNHQTVTVFND